MMTTSAGTFPGMKKARLWKRAILWWFRGRWWAKILKITALAVILYNVLAFILMWCPPVRGVVLDIETNRPIAGAIVQKSGVGPFVFYSESPGGARTGGAHAQAVTDGEGRFSFAGAFAHPAPRTHSWFDVLWPLQWLDTIGIKVWHRDYIGASSFAEGLWWKARPADHSQTYCEIRRSRIPVLGFRYIILLRKAATEPEWRVKIGSVNLGGIEGGQAVEQERLFDDLTGYLERWPRGEKAGEYLLILMDQIADGDSPANIDYGLRGGELSKAAIPIILKRNRAILDLASRINPPQEPHRVVVTFANYEQRLEAIRQCTSYLETISSKGGGK